MSDPKAKFMGDISIEDVMSVESMYYSIQVGFEFFEHKGKYAFSRKRCVEFYNKIRDNLNYLVKNGTDQEKVTAIRVLSNFRVIPLRIH